MAPLISVVIPTYNRAHKIEQAIRSVQNQTFQDWELIISDDGSKDNTREVVKKFMQSDARIHYIHQEVNRGAQAARNRGIKEAKGEWIAFLDSDDTWLPESLERRLGVAKKENVSVVHSDAYIQHENKPLERYWLPEWKGDIYKKIISKEGPMFQALLVKKEALEKINLLDENIVAYQEWDTSIRLAKHFEFGFEPAPTFIYDYTCRDSISRDGVRAAQGYEQIFKKIFWNIFFLAGPSTLAYHFVRMADWYKEGKDEVNYQRCRKNELICKLLSPKMIFRKLKILFKLSIL